MNSRKYSRTMQEAFGPYCSRELSEPPHDYSPSWYVWMAAIAAVATIVIVWFA